MQHKYNNSSSKVYWFSRSADLITRFLLVCLLGLAIEGQILGRKTTPTLERSHEIVSLLNDARLAAPELGMDTFLKVVESKKVIDSVWRKEIIDEALSMTEDVKNSVQLRPVQIRGVNLNNTEGYMIARAHSQKLDRLSLKSRILTLLVDTDRERAKQIVFEMGGQLGLKPRSCTDNLTYEVTDIYVAVGKVAKSAFTEREIAEGRRAVFLAPWLENIESPVQIMPALDLLEQLQGSAAERQILFNAFSRAINKNFKDDRSFVSAVTWGSGLGARIGKLVAGEPDPLKTDLNIGYREFLLKNLRGTRCRDNEIKKGEPLPKFIETANQLLPQKPLAFEDVTASELNDAAKFVDVFARSASVQKLKSELMPLKGKVVDNKIVNDSGPEWESRVLEFIEKAISWEGGNNETESETLMVKAAMFAAMLESINDGELKKSVVRKFLRYLAGSPMQKNGFVEWLSLLRTIRDKNELLFVQLAPEFPNQNLKVILAAKRLDNVGTADVKKAARIDKSHARTADEPAQS